MPKLGQIAYHQQRRQQCGGGGQRRMDPQCGQRRHPRAAQQETPVAAQTARHQESQCQSKRQRGPYRCDDAELTERQPHAARLHEHVVPLPSPTGSGRDPVAQRLDERPEVVDPRVERRRRDSGRAAGQLDRRKTGCQIRIGHGSIPWQPDPGELVRGAAGREQEAGVVERVRRGIHQPEWRLRRHPVRPQDDQAGNRVQVQVDHRGRLLSGTIRKHGTDDLGAAGRCVFRRHEHDLQGTRQRSPGSPLQHVQRGNDGRRSLVAGERLRRMVERCDQGEGPIGSAANGCDDRAGARHARLRGG